MTDAPSPTPPARRSVHPARLAIVALIGLVAVVAAVALAAALNDPVGAGARDPQANMPEVVGNPGADGTDERVSLPALALISNRQLPADLRSLQGDDLLTRLRARVASAGSAGAYVDLGNALQSLGRATQAGNAYRQALKRDPADLAARVGLLLVPAASRKPAALARADAALAALEQRFPEEQVPVFNRAWLAVYRADAPTAKAGFERTLALDATTPLGQLSQRLLGMASAPEGMGTTP